MTTLFYTICFWSLVFLGLAAILSIKFKIIPIKFSYPGMFGLVLLALILAIVSHPTIKALGILSPTLTDIIVYSLTTLVCGALIVWLNKHFYHQKPIGYFWAKAQRKISFYVLLSSPAQEFLFRSFLFYSLGLMGWLNIFSMTIMSCLLFGFAHLGYGDKYLSQGTFIMGVIWGLTYYLFPNLILISISHALIGLLAFSQGLIRREIF